MTPKFIENIKYLRKLHNVAQSELAVHIGKGSSTISNWESEKQSPDIVDFIKICNFFSVPVSDMIYSDLKSFLPEHVRSLRYNKDIKLRDNDLANKRVFELIRELYKTIENQEGK